MLDEKEYKFLFGFLTAFEPSQFFKQEAGLRESI